MLKYKRQKFLIRKAVSAGDVIQVQRFIACGGKVQRHCSRALVNEVRAGNVGAVSVFIRAGVDYAYGGHSAFRYALMFGHLEIAKILVAAGVSVANLPFDPMRLAVTFGYPEIIKLLLANGARIAFGDFTMLDLTVENALNISTSPPYGTTEEVWTACVDVLLDHSLGWPLSPSEAEQVAKRVAQFEPCKAKARAWLAHYIGRP